MFQLLFLTCLHFLNAKHSNQKHFYFPIILMNDIKQQGIFSGHSAYSLSAWASWMCKEALGSCLGALMSLLEHCNKDYLNFLCRTEDLISLLPSTTNTGQLKIIAVLKPQIFFFLYWHGLWWAWMINIH